MSFIDPGNSLAQNPGIMACCTRTNPVKKISRFYLVRLVRLGPNLTPAVVR